MQKLTRGMHEPTQLAVDGQPADCCLRRPAASNFWTFKNPLVRSQQTGQRMPIIPIERHLRPVRTPRIWTADLDSILSRHAD